MLFSVLSASPVILKTSWKITKNAEALDLTQTQWVRVSTDRAWVRAKTLEWRPTPCDPLGWSLLGPSVHEILWKTTGVSCWVAISFSRGSSWLRDQTLVYCISCIAGGFFTTEPQGKPKDRAWEPVFSEHLSCYFDVSSYQTSGG